MSVVNLSITRNGYVQRVDDILLLMEVVWISVQNEVSQMEHLDVLETICSDVFSRHKSSRCVSIKTKSFNSIRGVGTSRS